jgi:hypothetical protein
MRLHSVKYITMPLHCVWAMITDHPATRGLARIFPFTLVSMMLQKACNNLTSCILSGGLMKQNTIHAHKA